jgi:hypothetical protein
MDYRWHPYMCAVHCIRVGCNSRESSCVLEGRKQREAKGVMFITEPFLGGCYRWCVSVCILATNSSCQDKGEAKDGLSESVRFTILSLRQVNARKTRVHPFLPAYVCDWPPVPRRGRTMFIGALRLHTILRHRMAGITPTLTGHDCKLKFYRIIAL